MAAASPTPTGARRRTSKSLQSLYYLESFVGDAEDAESPDEEGFATSVKAMQLTRARLTVFARSELRKRISEFGVAFIAFEVAFDKLGSPIKELHQQILTVAQRLGEIPQTRVERVKNALERDVQETDMDLDAIFRHMGEVVNVWRQTVDELEAIPDELRPLDDCIGDIDRTLKRAAAARATIRLKAGNVKVAIAAVADAMNAELK